MSLSFGHILVVLLLVLLLFGANRVPSIAENLAKGVKSFKKGLKDDDDQPSSLPKKKDE